MVRDEAKQVSDERYNIIMSRYVKFQAAMSDVDLNVVRVFDPLTQKQLDELNLIREVSQQLQKKKEEDLDKAKEAEANEEIKEEAVESPEKEEKEEKEA